MKKDQAREIAAQVWCEPAHCGKVMDTDFAESIANRLVEATSIAACRRTIYETLMSDPSFKMSYVVNIAERLCSNVRDYGPIFEHDRRKANLLAEELLQLIFGEKK